MLPDPYLILTGNSSRTSSVVESAQHLECAGVQMENVGGGSVIVREVCANAKQYMKMCTTKDGDRE